MAALLMVLTAVPVAARDPDVLPSAHHEAARILSAELAMTQALKQLNALKAQPAPVSLLDTVRLELAIAGAAYAYRNAARQEQLRVNELASYASVERSVLPLLPAAMRTPLQAAIAGRHSLYILEGIDQYYLVNVHFTLPYADAKPIDVLRSFYQEAYQKYKVHPSYLASINFIESKFGRVLGPSSAGAQGPMQFLPSTWVNYGEGGDINDPHDAIMAAARYLVHYGAPGNMRSAIYHYNLDFNYVNAVMSFALAYRADPSWLDRMYYWDTTG